MESIKVGHTPGPWKVTPFRIPERDDDPMGVYRIESAERDLTQRYFEAEVESPELDAVHAENAANARLIAAAPELLAVAQHVIAMSDDAYLIGHPEWTEIVNESRAAIAKATGGES